MAEENKIRVAIIAGQLVVGGAERQLYLWLSNIDRESYAPIVLTLHPGHGDHWEKPIEALNIPLHRISPQKNRIKRLQEITRILKTHQPHLIHGWHLFTSPYAGFSAKSLNAHCLGNLRDSFRRFYQNPIPALLSLILTDGIIVNSKSAAIRVKKIRLRNQQRIFCIQNAYIKQSIKMRSREDLMRFCKINRDTIVIASIGRLDPKKRFDLLLRTISLLDQNTDFHLVIIGDGPDKEKLKKLACQLGLNDRVTFMGEIPNAETWLKAFDIFTFTSLDEGMPNVIMEAAAAGLPIVTWKLPFYEELLENEVSGLLVEPEDLEKMKESIIRLIKSPELRQQLGNKAREKILENFSLVRYIQNMTAAYEEVLKISEHRKNQKR